MKWNPPKLLVRLSAVGFAVGGAVLLRDYLGGPDYKGKENLDGKTVIVTGANCGIGKETATDLARRGARVILACRSLESCNEARKEIILNTRNKKVVCKECDLASYSSVRKFAASLSDEPNINILVNNAGVMRCEYGLTKDGVELQLGTNHMGHFLLTNLLLPKLKASAPSRIINVSSVAHKRGTINFEDLNSERSYDKAAAYNQSKLANIVFTRELAEHLEGSGVTCNAVHPGIVKTNLTRHMAIDKSLVAKIFAQPILWLFLKTPHQGAQTVIYACLSPDLENVSGKYFGDQKKAEVSAEAKDKNVATRLWLTSEKWTGLQ